MCAKRDIENVLQFIRDKDRRERVFDEIKNRLFLIKKETEKTHAVPLLFIQNVCAHHRYGLK